MFASRVAVCPTTKNKGFRTAARYATHLIILLATLTFSGLTAQHTIPTDAFKSMEAEYAQADLREAYGISSVVEPTLAVDQELFPNASVARETSVIGSITQVIVVGMAAYIAYRSGRAATSRRLAFSVNDEVSTESAATDTAEVEHSAPVKEDNAFVLRVKSIIASKYGEESFGLPDLCCELSMSRSQLFRRLKAEANVAPSAMIRGYRLERAREQLLNGADSVKEVAYAVGFREPAHFSRVFRDTYGVVPSSLLKKSV